MLKETIFVICLLKLAQARYGFVPRFYGHDIAVIVDTDKFYPPNKNASTDHSKKIKLTPPIALWQHYPRYHIMPPPPPGQVLVMNNWPKVANMKLNAMSKTKFTTTSTTSTTTTTTPKPSISSTTYFNADEFPPELLYIARNKLGLKNLDEIPSIVELGQLLGTNSREETMEYIKQLASNEQGVALMKAYIESTDYTDNTGDLTDKNYDLQYDEDDETKKNNDEGLMVVTDEDSNEDYKDNTHGSISNAKVTQKFNDMKKKLPHKNAEDNVTKEYQEINRITLNGNKFSKKQQSPTKNSQTKIEISKDLEVKQNNLKTPILVRTPIPFNYPVPLRARTTKQTTTTKSSPNANIPAVHLNTPKTLLPHIQEISRVTKIPPKTIEDFLATKPKLLEMANKVSRFPISYERNSPIEKQIIAAVQRALEQDNDLKKFSTSMATLK